MKDCACDQRYARKRIEQKYICKAGYFKGIMEKGIVRKRKGNKTENLCCSNNTVMYKYNVKF
jgi:hypothetical protein